APVLLVARRLLLLARLIGLRLSYRIGLRLARLAALVAKACELAVDFVGVLIAHVVVHALLLWLLLLRLVLPELLLGRRDDAEVMLRVLVIVLSRDRIAGALCITRELQIFLGDVGGG